jgi:hypothetical protein
MATHDQFHDPAHARLRHLLVENPEAAEFLKEASIEDTAPPLPPGAYAWPERQLFPVHTPEHAALSALYAKEASDVPERVRLKIADACDAHEVPPAISAPPRTKVASVNPQECIFPETGLYPVTTPSQVKTAEMRLLGQITKLSATTRAEAFARLAKAAEFHAVKLTPSSYQLAGKTACDTHMLSDHLRARADATRDPALRAKFASLAEAVSSDGASLRAEPTRIKVAATIARLDRDAGFDKTYDKQFLDPMQTVHNTTKVASEAVEMGGRAFSPDDFARIPASLYSDALGPDILSAIAPGGNVDAKQASMVLATLPADLKRAFARSVTAAGL